MNLYSIDEIIAIYDGDLTPEQEAQLRTKLLAKKQEAAEGLKWWQKLWLFISPLFKEALLILAEQFINKKKPK